MAKQTRARIISEPNEQRPAPILVIGSVIMKTHMVTFLRVGIERAAMRIVRRTFLHLRSHDSPQESKELVAVIDAGDRRRNGLDGIVGDTPTLFVTGQIIAMNLWHERRQMAVPSLQNFRWQKIRHHDK